MANQDWSNLGNDIKNMVQSAIDSQNFKQLNENIGRTINDAMEAVNQGIHQAGDKVKSKPQNPWENKRVRTPYSAAQKTNVPKIYSSTSGATGAGIALSVLGYTFSGGFGIALLVLGLIGMLGGGFGFGSILAMGIILPLLIGSIAMAGKGTSLLGRAKRFRHYIRQIGDRSYCSVKELADSLGKSHIFVTKDLRHMIRKGMFQQGHLDPQGSCLMVTEEAFQQYRLAQEQLLLRQQAGRNTEQKAEAEGNESGLPEEVRKVIEDGNKFLMEIKESNEGIRGAEISQKISRMELIIRKIFQRVEQRPELISDMRKFMDYYLPTTVKLLNAYEELDAQPVQGANIISSKKEIEGTLDTINQAFENLLDGFFQNTAWDISSDITVLQTMLAQEGLTNTDFTKKAKEIS